MLLMFAKYPLKFLSICNGVYMVYAWWLFARISLFLTKSGRGIQDLSKLILICKSWIYFSYKCYFVYISDTVFTYKCDAFHQGCIRFKGKFHIWQTLIFIEMLYQPESDSVSFKEKIHSHSFEHRGCNKCSLHTDIFQRPFFLGRDQ